MFYLDLLLEPKYANEHEQEYTESLLSQWEYSISRIFLILAAMAWFPLVIFSLLGLIDSPESHILITYSILQASVSLWLLSKSHPPRVWQRYIFSILIVSQMVWTAAAFIDTSDGEGRKTLIRTWVVYMMLGNMFLPLQSRFHQMMLGIVVPTTVWALLKYPNPTVALLVTGVAIIAGQNCQIFARRLAKIDAISTFRNQSKYIPRQVLMKAARSNSSILDVFRPSEKFCICICSDWRNFRSLLSDDTASTVGQSVVAYYEAVVAMLSSKFPDGRFFVDWIADELFIVIFADSLIADKALVRKSFELTKEMVAFRAIFASQHGYPDGIDVGVSAGIASVGIFGNGGIAKATAFSSIPGVARRLQQLSKRLEKSIGLQDRVVMTAIYADLLVDKDRSVSEFKLMESLKVKDLDAESVFIWPRTVEESVAQQYPGVNVTAA